MELPSTLTKKLGPLPVWAWGAIIGGAWIGVGMLKGGTSATAATAGPFATAPADSSSSDPGGSSSILGGTGTTAPVTGGSGDAGGSASSGSGSGTSGGASSGGGGSFSGQLATPQGGIDTPAISTPAVSVSDPTNGGGAAGPSIALPQTSVLAVSATPTPYIGSASQPALAPVASIKPTAGAAKNPAPPPTYAQATAGILNSPSLTGSPTVFPTSNPTLTPLTAVAGGASTPVSGSSGGGSWVPSPVLNLLNSPSLTKTPAPAPVKGSSGGGSWVPLAPISMPQVSAPKTTVTIAPPVASNTPKRVAL